MRCFPSDCDTGCTYMCLRPKPVIQQLVPETVPKTPTHSTPAAFPVLVCLSSKLQTPIIICKTTRGWLDGSAEILNRTIIPVCGLRRIQIEIQSQIEIQISVYYIKVSVM